MGGKSSVKNGLALHWKILIALILGVVVGGLAQAGFLGGAKEQIIYVLSLGASIFLKLLKMCIVPMVVSSLFVGVCNVSSTRDLGRIGGRTGIYYLFTSLMSISVGLLVVNVLKPGVGADIQLGNAAKTVTPPSSLFDVISRIVPSNPFEALATMDMMGIIFFTIVFAIFTLKVGGKSRETVLNFFQAIYEIMMKLVEGVINLAPIGVFCLLAKLVANTGFSAFVPLSKYLLAVSAALAIHFFVILPLLYAIFTKKNGYKYMSQMSPALLTAFSSASSAATLPLTMECTAKNNAVSKKISSMVLPLGATVNMDGTALYEGVAVLFIAQVMGVDLSLGSQIIVLFTALLVSIGAAGIPHAGLVMMVIILQAVGLPLEATGMIWAVDRVVDMARTATNVWSDSVGAAVIDSQVGES